MISPIANKMFENHKQINTNKQNIQKIKLPNIGKKIEQYVQKTQYSFQSHQSYRQDQTKIKKQKNFKSILNGILKTKRSNNQTQNKKEDKQNYTPIMNIEINQRINNKYQLDLSKINKKDITYKNNQSQLTNSKSLKNQNSSLNFLRLNRSQRNSKLTSRIKIKNQNKQKYQNSFLFKQINEMQKQQKLSQILKSIRSTFQNHQKFIQQSMNKKIKNNKQIKKKLNKIQRLQKKVLTTQSIRSSCNIIETSDNQNQDKLQQIGNQKQIQEISQTKKQKNSRESTRTYNLIEMTFYNNPHSIIESKQIILKYKPPHRCRTQMIAYHNNLLLFGGLGCEKNLSWVKIGFHPQNLELPKYSLQEDLTQARTIKPYYGHSMKLYKGNAYIYGGFNIDTLDQLNILNIKTMKFRRGPFAPFKRMQHSAVMYNKYMIVYGGIDNNQTKNNLFYYDTETGYWHSFQNTNNLPYLSHHSMIAVPIKSKRKILLAADCSPISTLSDHASYQIYIFGGKNQKGQASNKLYKLRLIQNGELNFTFQQLISDRKSEVQPQKRYSCCFQYIQNGNILLYGGKNDEQKYDSHVKNGIFSDVYIFNIFKRVWRKQEINLQCRHSMASTTIGNKVLIYGGYNDKSYADANIILIKTTQKQQNNTESSKYIVQQQQSKLNLYTLNKIDQV